MKRIIQTAGTVIITVHGGTISLPIIVTAAVVHITSHSIPIVTIAGIIVIDTTIFPSNILRLIVQEVQPWEQGRDRGQER